MQARDDAGWIENHRSVIIAKGGALCLAALYHTRLSPSVVTG